MFQKILPLTLLLFLITKKYFYVSFLRERFINLHNLYKSYKDFSIIKMAQQKTGLVGIIFQELALETPALMCGAIEQH